MPLRGSSSIPSFEDALVPFSRDILREVAHCLRSPLGSIAMMAEALLDHGTDITPDRFTRQLAIIHRAAVGAATMAGDLLVLADGAPEPGPLAPFDGGYVLERVAHVVRPLTEVCACDLAVRVDGDPKVIGPASAVARALLGLALRAGERTRQGTVWMSLEHTPAHAARFQVTARGVGAAPDGGITELLQVFQRDPDGDGYTLSTKALGLLATERLIQAMGAQLMVGCAGGDELALAFDLPQPTRAD
jgi:signal transduction histidine kinase